MTLTQCLPRGLKSVAQVLVLSFGALVLTACSGSSNSGLPETVGVDTGVTITTASDVTSMQEGATLKMTASVTSGGNGEGVTWSISGAGTLSDQTTTSATYNAPTGVTGETSAVITATSVADSTKLAAITLITLGSPVINAVTLFPAFDNVAYAASIEASGGESPYSWKMTSGSLPSGMSLSSSTTSLTAVSGTPTETGTFTFTLLVTDNESRTYSQSFTLVVNAENACLLSGQFNLMASGFRGNRASTHVASINIDASTGTITGEQDYKAQSRTIAGETLTSGQCKNRSTNSGTLELDSASGTIDYDFSVTPPDSTNTIRSARLELIHSGSDSGSGQLTVSDTSAYNAGTVPTGNFAFGLMGVDGSQLHHAMAGRFTMDSSAAISGGLIDSNDSTYSLSDQALSGTMTAPDSSGRGTLTLQSGSLSTQLAYYIVSANKMFVIDIDPSGGGLRETGLITAQTGNVSANTFSADALTTPSIVSLWGRIGDTEPVSVAELGRLSGGSSSTLAVNLQLDSSVQATDAANVAWTSSYTVDANGHGTLTAVNGSTTRHFALYLDSAANGYLIEQGGSSGSGGLLETQTADGGSGTYPDTYATAFVGGTQYAQANGPISLNPVVYMNYGTLSSTYTSGSFAIDTTTGRGVGELSQTGVGTTAAALYEVSSTKINVLRFGTRAIDGTIEWLIAD